MCTIMDSCTDLTSDYLCSTSTNDNKSDSLCRKRDISSLGTLKFHRNHDHKAKFIRISPSFSPEHVKEMFIIEQKPPKHLSLVISLLGSAKEGHMRSKLFQLFRESLLELAKTTNIWIISAGLNSRIAKFFGEIIHTIPDPERPIYLIGIAAWGCVSGTEQFNDSSSTVEYTKSKSDDKDESLLEPNHTHFIFIDDGTKHKHKCALQYRGQFERVILSESPSFYSNNIPIIIIVIEGCSDAIRKVHRSVMNDRVPVFFSEGTGGCCDLFAKCYHLYNKYKSKGTVDEEIKNKIRQTLRITDSELDETSCTNAPVKGTNYFELIYECVEKRNEYLNFLDLKTHGLTGYDINCCILQAFLKISSKNSLSKKREQLNLAYEWKQIDIIQNSIMTGDHDWKKMNLNVLFEKALRDNQVDFIQLCLDHDFSLEDFFADKQKLIDLYQHESFHFEKSIPNTLKLLHRNILEPLVGGFFQVDSLADIDECITSATVKEFNINQELFYWSIATNRHELALFFWNRERNKICNAFIGMLIYKHKSKKDKNMKYKFWINQFEQLAVTILEQFYLTDCLKCKLAIVRTIPEFHHVTWLQLAVMAESKLFIAKTAVQDTLKHIWYGRISYETGNGPIIFSSLMLWYSPFLSYQKQFIEENNRTNRCLLDEQHRSNGIADEIHSKLINENSDQETNPTIAKKKSRKKLTPQKYFKNMSKFLSAPYVKYLYNLYAHMIFLILFSYVILCDYHPFYKFQSDKCSLNKKKQNDIGINKTNLTVISNSSLKSIHRPSITEFILMFWVFTLCCEEIRQIMSKKISHKIREHLSIFWNQVDAVAILLFFLACILRFLPCQSCYCLARTLLIIDLSIWFIRTLDIFSAFKRLGPKLVMIAEMIVDLKYFMLILAIFVLAFGVSAYSLIHNNQAFSWHMLRDIINLSYWQIFGELYAIDDIEDNYRLSGYIAFFLLIAFITIASVLLINLLIAMFSNIFDRLQSDTDCIWKFQQYSLVCYHLKRPLLPPPLIIISHIYRIFKKILERKSSKKKSIEETKPAKFTIAMDQTMTKQIEAIEDAIGHDVYRSYWRISLKQTNCDEKQLLYTQNMILDKINTLENQQSNMLQYLRYLMNGMQQIGEDEIEIPEPNCCDLQQLCRIFYYHHFWINILEH